MCIFSAYISAGCQQHGGSVCGWETSGGGARNHCPPGERHQIHLLPTNTDSVTKHYWLLLIGMLLY